MDGNLTYKSTEDKVFRVILGLGGLRYSIVIDFPRARNLHKFRPSLKSLHGIGTSRLEYPGYEDSDNWLSWRSASEVVKQVSTQVEDVRWSWIRSLKWRDQRDRDLIEKEFKNSFKVKESGRKENPFKYRMKYGK
ncbi:MAG: hypothetical protein J6I84_04080 [Bacilli bacterium]|nr:hypothetical protein [Bacilli bacterium]